MKLRKLPAHIQRWATSNGYHCDTDGYYNRAGERFHPITIEIKYNAYKPLVIDYPDPMYDLLRSCQVRWPEDPRRKMHPHYTSMK